MNKTGILVHDLGPSPANVEMLRELRKYLEKHPLDSINLFYKNATPHLGTYPYSILSFQELWCFDGDVITTSMDTTLDALNVPGIKKIIFYSYDLEWLHNGPNPPLPHKYSKLKVYRNPDLKIFVRSPSHKKILENNFNINNINICPSFSLEELTK